MRKDSRNIRAVNRNVYDDNIAKASSTCQSRLPYAKVRQRIKRAKDDIYPARFGCYADIIRALKNTDLPDLSVYYYTDFKYSVRGKFEASNISNSNL